ncbi:MAG: tail protein X [Rhodospirillaceae bacterium]|nr:tail protein X [Rhodospirillales bacterium]
MKTKDVEKGNVLDKVVRDHYGTADGTLEAVLAANPGLAAMGPVFTTRRTIKLPDVAPSALGARQTKLWD